MRSGRTTLGVLAVTAACAALGASLAAWAPAAFGHEVAGALAAEVAAASVEADERRAVENVYEVAAPVWFDAQRRPRAAVGIALDAIAHAGRDGLDPADYAPEALGRAVRDAQAPGASVDAVARADVALTVATLRLERDLRLGRVRPGDVEPHWRAPPRKAAAPAALRDAIAAEALPAWIASARPRFALYGRLADALARYRALEAQGAWVLLGAGPKRVDPGDSYPDARRLRERLILTGDLDAQAAPVAEGRYAAAIADGVRRFQRRHGLAPDGVLGRETLAALDVPPSARVAQIALAMERLRWLPDLPEGPLVAVNIPSFRLWALADPAHHPTDALSMPVIVGRAVRSETPVFLGSMERLEFSPYWNVPPGILRHEYLPRLARDPGLLAREDMEIVPVRGGAAVAPDDAAVRGLAAGTLRLRQRPGPKNALGGVKFVLPNTMDIYLHGTPARALFERTRRDFSHGCIRVGDPAALASFALRDAGGWNAATIDAAMSAGTPKSVALPRPIPVVVFYTTAVVDTDGTAFFLPDLYGHDARLASAVARTARSRASMER